jgi:glutathione peroxidase-family protein
MDGLAETVERHFVQVCPVPSKCHFTPGLTFLKALGNEYKRREINSHTQSDFPLLIVSCKEKKFFE